MFKVVLSSFFTHTTYKNYCSTHDESNKCSNRYVSNDYRYMYID